MEDTRCGQKVWVHYLRLFWFHQLNMWHCAMSVVWAGYSDIFLFPVSSLVMEVTDKEISPVETPETRRWEARDYNVAHFNHICSSPQCTCRHFTDSPGFLVHFFMTVGLLFPCPCVVWRTFPRRGSLNWRMSWWMLILSGSAYCAHTNKNATLPRIFFFLLQEKNCDLFRKLFVLFPVSSLCYFLVLQ